MTGQLKQDKKWIIQMRRQLIAFEIVICYTLSLLILSSCSKLKQNQMLSTNDPDRIKEKSMINSNLMQNNTVVRSVLSETETGEIARQSRILESLGIEDMTEETANRLAEYFVRCQRLDQTDRPSCITRARHVKNEQQSTNNDWEYWVLTSDRGIEYWLMGFTFQAFTVRFIFRNGPDGEILYGYYK